MSTKTDTETTAPPKAVAWELTRRCMLHWRHCRGAAEDAKHEGELSTDEIYRVAENIASFASPLIILTGGEPMYRDDVYDIAEHCTELGMRVVMAPCGMLVNEENARRMLDSGVRLISISLDGATAETHDAFRGSEGAFDRALESIEAAEEVGLGFQVNTTVSRHNLDELPDILELSEELGAAAFNPFMLVPTGRGREMADQELSAQQYEQVLQWLADQRGERDVRIRVTCGPQYQRIVRQSGSPPDRDAKAGGCLGGKSFAFISHRGKVQICGFLDVECGDLREADYDFRHIWHESEVLRRVRDVDSYDGKCGACEYRRVCGGCRARGFASTGDYMAEEPYCPYEPRGEAPDEEDKVEDLDERDRRLLTVVQRDFPLQRRPFDALDEQEGWQRGESLERFKRLKNADFIRRLGAIFDTRRLGYVSTLVAARVPEDRLRDVADMVSELSGVTHNYRRNHDYNLWFTLRAQSEEEIEGHLQRLRERTGIDDFHSLPAQAVYNRSVTFDLTGGDHSSGDNSSSGRDGEAVVLSEEDKELVRAVQAGLSVEEEPYAVLAAQLDRSLDEVLARLNEWLESGVIRRMGAVANHRKLGYDANGMAVFRVSPETADELGPRLASYPQVTHCYRRPTLPDWPYTLFGMIHDDTEQAVREHAAHIADELGIDEYDVLFSTEQFKKTSGQYFE